VASGSRMPTVKNVGEPCAGEPHARIDGGREETGTSRQVRAEPGASRLPDQPPQRDPRSTRALDRGDRHGQERKPGANKGASHQAQGRVKGGDRRSDSNRRQVKQGRADQGRGRLRERWGHLPWNTITPVLTVRDAVRAVAFYERASGAQEIYPQHVSRQSNRGGDGRGAARFRVADEAPEAASHGPRALKGTM
jgi:hypothetical protein